MGTRPLPTRRHAGIIFWYQVNLYMKSFVYIGKVSWICLVLSNSCQQLIVSNLTWGKCWLMMNHGLLGLLSHSIILSVSGRWCQINPNYFNYVDWIYAVVVGNVAVSLIYWYSTMVKCDLLPRGSLIPFSKYLSMLYFLDLSNGLAVLGNSFICLIDSICLFIELAATRQSTSYIYILLKWVDLLLHGSSLSLHFTYWLYSLSLYTGHSMYYPCSCYIGVIA